MPVKIDGTDITGATIDGQDVQEITVDGQTVFTAIPDSIVDNFEDGDISVLKDNWSGWSGDTGSFSAQQSTVLAGGYSGEFSTSSGSVDILRATRDTPDTPSEVKTLVRVTQRNNVSSDRIEFLINLSSGNEIANIQLRQNGVIDINRNSTSDSWSTNTTYLFRIFNIDFTSEEFDLEIVRQSDDTTISSVTGESFINSESEIDRIRLRHDANSNNGAITSVWDDFEWVE